MRQEPSKLSVFPPALVIALLLLGGCDFTIPGGSNPAEEEPPLQTRILHVEVDPNPVAPGDTARFTCIIADSTDESFRFSWSFNAGSPNGANTADNTVLWKAPNEVGMYTHAVSATNGSPPPASTPPTKQFSVTVEAGSSQTP